LFSATAPRRRDSIDKKEPVEASEPLDSSESVGPPEPMDAAETDEPSEPTEGDSAESAESADDEAEFELEEYVVDRDDYPDVIGRRRRAPESTTAQPDRVADIDDWLEEFAVEDCSDPFAD
jgi:hypothetical protein